MKSPIDILHETNILDERMRKRISGYYRHRGEKALEIVDDDRVKRYRDFFVVVGETGEYVVEGNYCSCEDFLHRGNLCAHILAVCIARAIGRYELIDLWYYQDLKEQGIIPYRIQTDI
ncbi:MAG TPA: SWIM zinc finger family protein [Methanospirillum hungatei]|nr:SWIM zinc finger family protein [Methanospirillum hungatei]